MSDSDKHCAYLLDPEGLDLNSELDGLDEDGVESMKREYVLHVCLFYLVDI